VRGAEGEEKGEEKAERHLVYLFVIFFFGKVRDTFVGSTPWTPVVDSTAILDGG